GAGGPGDAGFIDVLAESGVGLIAVIDDNVEPKTFLAVWKANFVEGNRGLDAVAVGGPARVEPGPGRGFFDRTLIGIGVAGGADDSGGVKWENAELERAKGVFGTDGGIQAN